MRVPVFALIGACLLLSQAHAACDKCCHKPSLPKDSPVNVLFHGEACECGRTVPVHFEALQSNVGRPVSSHGYGIQLPSLEDDGYVPEHLDFGTELIRTAQSAPAQDFGYNVYVVQEDEPQNPTQQFDVQIHSIAPVAHRQLNTLFSTIDRVVVPNPGCVSEDTFEDSALPPRPKQTCDCGCGRPYGTCGGSSKHKRHVDFLLNGYEPFSFRRKRGKPKAKTDPPLDDDVLLQMTLNSKKHKKETPKSPCEAYEYRVQRPKCSFRCRCEPEFDSPPSPASPGVEEIVAASLNDMPDQFDPILRLESPIEPSQFISHSPGAYQRLTEILSKKSSVDPGLGPGVPSPPPSQQTEDIIKLVIDLLENRKDVREFHENTHFEKPHDWMHRVDQDPYANRLNADHDSPFQQIYESESGADDRRPEKKYEILDQLAEAYERLDKKAPVPLEKLLEPEFRKLESDAELEKEKYLRFHGPPRPPPPPVPPFLYRGFLGRN